MNFAATSRPLDQRVQGTRPEGERGPAASSNAVLSVIVPVYNEVRNLELLLAAIKAAPVRKEIVVVDDGSTDGTREKLLALPPSDGVTILFHEKNCGKGAAIRTALRYVRGEYILIQDSDLEYDPEDYGALLAPLERGDTNVVYGVRPDRPERGLRFYWGAKFLTLAVNLLYRAGIHDEATCYKAFRRSVLEKIPLECTGFEFCPEVTAKLCRLGEEIWEVPISYRPRGRKEGKKLRPRDGWTAVWTLLRVRFASRRKLNRSSERDTTSPFAVAFCRLPPR
jgi:dolichol-phosphate mannosyltransferase